MKKEKLFDKPVLVRKMPFGDGIQRIYRFPNGYGASVVRVKFDFNDPIGRFLGAFCALMGGYFGSYTDNENEWELAVIKFKSEKNDDFELCYDTSITDDVIGHLTEEEVEKILHKIKNLPKVEKNK